jgi:outer membrane protein assembly factor BamB
MDSTSSTSRKPLRLWPGVVAAVFLLLVRFGLPIFFPNEALYAILGAVVGGLLILTWWLFFSRAPWSERLGAVILMVAAVFAARSFVHESIRGGMMGRMLPILLGIPFLSLALVVWAVISRGMAPRPRRGALVVAILLACAGFAVLRTDGITGEGFPQITWRWTPTAEERLLAQAGPDLPAAAPVPAPAAPSGQQAPAKTADTPAATPSAPAAAKTPETVAVKPAPDKPAATEPAPATAAPDPRAIWPGFRGPDRDSTIRGVVIDTDWTKSPPVAVWRRKIGPGWSSFAVRGDLLYTQEQRGDHEVVASYRASSGEPVWVHRDAVRFYESNGGPGPRATPTLSNGRLYSLGATGVLNALDAANGAVVWSRNAKVDTSAPLPGWGFAGSPLVVGDLLVVGVSGRLAGYDLATGNLRWTRTTAGGGYSSPHFVTIEGVPQILMPNGGGVTSVAPADGTVLWEQKGEGVSILQPVLLDDGEVLIAGGDMMGGTGIRRLAVSRKSGTWTVQERWASRGLKPYFSDFVVHKGHAYGFDGTILSCINLADGERKWKGGRYGAGQLVLLPDQDVLLVMAEEGELALVQAAPDKFTELARAPGIEGKTWNHPVVAGGVVLVRNGEEMAAFRLPRASR